MKIRYPVGSIVIVDKKSSDWNYCYVGRVTGYTYGYKIRILKHIRGTRRSIGQIHVPEDKYVFLKSISLK